MHLLYVVAFNVEGLDELDPHPHLLELTAEWLSRGSARAVAPDQLATSGQAELTSVGFGGAEVERIATWERLDTGGDTALRLSVLQTLDSGVELTTRVTIAKVAGRVSFRVGMSREFTGGALTPVRETSVFQPGIVEAVARDARLVLKIDGQQVDERFQMVKTPQEASVLVDVLRSPARLPILLVHSRTLGGRDAAYYASRKLVGLVRVVTLNFATRDVLQRALPPLVIPFGGARLVWSDVAASGIELTAEKIATGGRESLRNALMQLLAPVSALVRGVDDGWREVRQSVARAARAQANERIHLAQQAADTGAELEAMREKVALLEAEVKEAHDLAESYSADLESAKSTARSIEDAQADAEYWKGQYLGQFTSVDEQEEAKDPWDEVPVLEAGVDPSDTFLALMDASDSRIMFTDNAERSWQKISYPDPEDMTEALTTLARAACQLYGDEPGTIGRIDDWFKTNFGINVATSDDTIEKSKALRDFEFEGKTWNQKNHVKVRDGVKPNEVGRIHFDFDHEGKRLIVNHVALKLYGI